MGDDVISKRNRKSVEAAVEHFVGNRHLFENFAQALMAYFRNDAGLARCTQFLKYRVKDPGHLREKLIRKAAQGDVIDETTLFDRITDLAGIRIIHLHTDQVRDIHLAIQGILAEQQLRLVEGCSHKMM